MLAHNLIIWHNILDSTNKRASEQLENLDNLSVIATLCQTDGRGQQGNRWDSESAKNLLFSIVLKKFNIFCFKEISVKDSFLISRAAALSVVRFLWERAAVQAQIKWPNDIYVGDKKICGILIENGFCGKSLSHSIVGIGINMGQRKFPPHLPNPTSLAIECDRDFQPKDLREELHYFHKIFSETLQIPAPELCSLYHEKMYRRSGFHPFKEKENKKTFIAEIIDCQEDGRLCLRKENGEIGKYFFKEVEFVI